MTADESDIPVETLKEGIRHYENGKLHMSDAEYRKAIDCFLEAMRVTCDDAAIWDDIAECYLLMDNREACVTAIRRAIELDPDRAESHHNLGLLLIDSDIEETEQQARRACEIVPTISNCWLLLGRVFYRTNRPVEAMKVLGTAIGLATDNADAYYYLGEVLEELSQYKKAETAFRKAIEIFPDNVEYLKSFGAFLFGRSRYEEAREMLLRAHESDPYDHEVLTGLAGVIIAQIRSNKDGADPDLGERAMEYLNKSLELTVYYGKTWYHWGEIHLMLRNYEAGEQAFRTAIDAGFDIPESYMWLSGCLGQLGREKEATEMFEEYKRRRPQKDEGVYE